MAFFNVRQWIDRVSQFPNRRTLTNVEDPTDVKTYDLDRAEGDVSVRGTAITGANLTDLENRIGAAFTAVENAMPEANPAQEATGSLTKLKVGGTVYEVEGGGGGTTIEKITKAEWDAMTAEERAAFIGVVEDTNADYVPLTAENIPYDSENSIAEKIDNLTAEDLSYDGGTTTTKQKIEAKSGYIDESATNIHIWNFPSSTAQSWVATDDCIIVGTLISGSNNSAYVNIGSITCGYAYSAGSNSVGTGVCIPVKKGQTVTVGRGDTGSLVYAMPLK